MKKLLPLLLLLGLALTQSSGTPFGVRLSALPATTSSPSLSVTGEVVGLPAGVPVTVRLEARYVDPATGKTVSRSKSGRTVYTPPVAQPRILVAYYTLERLSNPVVPTQTSQAYSYYLPNGFTEGLDLSREPGTEPLTLLDAGPYAGLDVLIVRSRHTPYQQWADGGCLIYQRLSRPSRVGMLWWGDPAKRPGWYRDGWVAGQSVQARAWWGSQSPVGVATFWRDFPAGEFCAPTVDKQTTVLPQFLYGLADPSSPVGVKPDAYPKAPQGEQPKPNAYCPAWVGEQPQYRTLDGKYPTWRPQIDPVYWCYFGNEHGSNPRQFPEIARLLDSGRVSLPFGAVEDAGNVTPACVQCHTERLNRPVVKSPPGGYKVVALRTPNAVLDSPVKRVTWVRAFQLRSDSRARLCQIHHEYHLIAVDSDSGELLANLQFAADSGNALNASARDDPTTPGRNEANDTFYAPRDCPENWRPNLEGEGGRRRIPQLGEPGYETWQFVFPRTLGMRGAVVYNLDNPRTRCSGETDEQGRPTCDQMLETGSFYNQGDNRWMVVPGGDQPGLEGGFRLTTAASLKPEGGRFCTDVLGTSLRDCAAPDALEQFLAPNLDIQQKDEFRWIPFDGWDMPYRGVKSGGVVADGVQGFNLEGALRAPN